MALKVLDFYAANKLSRNKLGKLLMHEALFCVMVEFNGVVKELATMVTKRYRYTERKRGNYFIPKKIDEYNILVDFLMYAKSRIVDKWNLSENDYQDLVKGLEICLIQKYSTCSPLKRALLLGQGMFSRLFSKIKRRFM